MTEGTTMLAATRYRAAERLPPIVRAVLDARDEAAVVFGARGDVLYLNQAAQITLPPATITPSIDSGLVRALLNTLGGDVVPLQSEAQVLGELIVVPHPNGGTLAEREHDAIHETLRQTGGRLAQAARRLGISRTTLWRRLRAERRSQKP
jgi:DNA-binding NtrC family response regulator